MKKSILKKTLTLALSMVVLAGATITANAATVSFNDYETAPAVDYDHSKADEAAKPNANADVEGWIWDTGMYYSGQLIPVKDPTNSDNICMRHRAFITDTSILRISDEYLDYKTEDAITVEAGTTYKISFKWMTEGKAYDNPEFGIALAKTPDGATYIDKVTELRECVAVQRISTGTEGTLEWKEETVEFAVTDEMDLTTYNQLVIYAQCGGNYNAHSDDGALSIYFDDVKVTTGADDDDSTGSDDTTTGSDDTTTGSDNTSDTPKTGDATSTVVYVMIGAVLVVAAVNMYLAVVADKKRR